MIEIIILDGKGALAKDVVSRWLELGNEADVVERMKNGVIVTIDDAEAGLLIDYLDEIGVAYDASG